MSAAGIAILVALGGLLLHLGLGLLSRETTGQVHHLSRVILRLAVRKVPLEFRLRYQEEWDADLIALNERPLSSFAFALRIWRRAGSMAAELAAPAHPGITTPTESRVALPSIQLSRLTSRYVDPLRDLGEFGTTLEESVRQYLLHGFRIEEAAKVLVIHPNTLRHRLDRYQQLTGADLRSMPDLVGIWVALRGDRLWE